VGSGEGLFSHEDMLKNEKLDGIVASTVHAHGTLVPELLKAVSQCYGEADCGFRRDGREIVKP